MRFRTFHQRSLLFYRRSNVAVALGAAVGTAVLTGALLVGDSMRASLREAALGRLGRVDHALTSHRFFRETLARELASPDRATAGRLETHPVILLHGSATHARTHARTNRITVLGIADRFWELERKPPRFIAPALTGRSAILNEALARELGAKPGDDVLLHVGKPGTISTETLLGRREDTTAALRLTVRAVIPAEGVGALSLSPRQRVPRNAFVPLLTLQRALDRRERVNTILVACDEAAAPSTVQACETLDHRLKTRAALEDLGLTVRVDRTHDYVALESDAMWIDPAVESAAVSAAGAAGAGISGVLTYLANRITLSPCEPTRRQTEPGAQAMAETASAGGSNVPYSTVSAIEPESDLALSLRVISGDAASALKTGEILLNEWAASDLQANVGDCVSLTYYTAGSFGRLKTERATFTLRGVVALGGAASDPSLTPPYQGITDTDNLADWNPPFPMDLKAIREKDEAYWDQYRTTPKAFLTLSDGQRLWAREPHRFGRLTSMRITPRRGATPEKTAKTFRNALLKSLDLPRLGLAFDPLRARFKAASEGTTDFGMLFVSFSFFLMVSAGILVALLFRLSVERRRGEIGLLLALGFQSRTVTGLVVAEGAALAAVGGVAGVVLSLAYAWLMLAGLRSRWSDAVPMPLLGLHVARSTLVLGAVAGFLLATLSMVWSIRGLTKRSARSLLAGVERNRKRSAFPRAVRPASLEHGRHHGEPDAGDSRFKQPRLGASLAAAFALASAVLMLVLPLVTSAVAQTVAFFVSGAAMLVAALSLFARYLQSEPVSVIHHPGPASLVRLAARNARRHRGRSILTATLVASATFLIAGLEAFRLQVDSTARERKSGTGGFSLFAETTVPLLYDLNTPEGREALNLSPQANRVLDGVTFAAFRLRGGDESSCLNLYRPVSPRLLGAGSALISRDGFVFAETLAESQAERDNPWTLLQRAFPDGAIPVIGDESAVLWQLHLGLGRDLRITDGHGRDVRLRFVALLAGSVLQDELIIAEPAFVQLFPSLGGYGFFLLDPPPGQADAVQRMLEEELAAFGFDVASTTERLAGYLRVQNTYLSTFQTLGGLGLMLGTIGLAAVLLRNVWERRGELALMRAMGFSHASLGWLVLVENVLLLTGGLAAGWLSAMLALAPHLAARTTPIPWGSVGLTLVAVFITGTGVAIAATVSTLRAPLLPALRRE